MTWLLSKLFSIDVLAKALAMKKDVFHMTVMTSADLNKMHREVMTSADLSKTMGIPVNLGGGNAMMRKNNDLH